MAFISRSLDLPESLFEVLLYLQHIFRYGPMALIPFVPSDPEPL
jgi:hypothetical protein